MIHTAMILAAGEGTRMRPLTLQRPKPMIEVAGRSLLQRILARLKTHGIERVIVNARPHAAMLKQHLAAEAKAQKLSIQVVVEQTSLETGGGVVHALPWLGADPFFVINGDALWTEASTPLPRRPLPRRPLLQRMTQAWAPNTMDLLLAVVPPQRIGAGYEHCDFAVNPAGLVISGTPSVVFMGVQILNPACLQDHLGETSFSLRRIYAQAQQRQRLFTLEHQGRYDHVGTPQALAAAEASWARTP